jgi:hypothetical protein
MVNHLDFAVSQLGNPTERTGKSQVAACVRKGYYQRLGITNIASSQRCDFHKDALSISARYPGQLLPSLWVRANAHTSISSVHMYVHPCTHKSGSTVSQDTCFHRLMMSCFMQASALEQRADCAGKNEPRMQGTDLGVGCLDNMARYARYER